MDRWVKITFDCLPLRSVTRMDIPLDASPTYRERCERIKFALEKHGSHNTYYLYNARCIYHLVNSDKIGTIEFKFEGTVVTGQEDMHCQHCDLEVVLTRETCDWLTEPIANWFAETVPRSVAVEFDHYVKAGDLEQARKRIEQIQAASDDADGFVGMYL